MKNEKTSLFHPSNLPSLHPSTPPTFQFSDGYVDYDKYFAIPA
jgi:hypothetical protein